jgi:hypothetical protein
MFLKGFSPLLKGHKAYEKILFAPLTPPRHTQMTL